LAEHLAVWWSEGVIALTSILEKGPEGMEEGFEEEARF
jgi:hypothetical protein